MNLWKRFDKNYLRLQPTIIESTTFSVVDFINTEILYDTDFNYFMFVDNLTITENIPSNIHISTIDHKSLKQTQNISKFIFIPQITASIIESAQKIFQCPNPDHVSNLNKLNVIYPCGDCIGHGYQSAKTFEYTCILVNNDLTLETENTMSLYDLASNIDLDLKLMYKDNVDRNIHECIRSTCSSN